MAYVFDNIDASLGGSGAQSPQNNVFETSAPPPPQGGAAQQQQASAPSLKTSTSADVGPSGSAANSSVASVSGKSPQQNSDAAVAKNSIDFQGLPGGQFQSSVDKINQNLQSQADNYVQGTVNSVKSAVPTQATLDSAINGDQNANTAVASRLNSAMAPVSGFELSPNTSTNVQDLQSLNSQAGLAGLMSRNAASDYTTGMANLDAQLMGQNKDFIASRQGLNQAQDQINATAADTGAVTSRAQQAALAAYDQGTGFLRDYLGQRETGLQSAAQQAMQGYNTGLNQTLAGKDSYVQGEERAALADALKANPKLAAYLPKASVAADPFYHAASAAADPRAFYSADQARQFNTIEGLLGGHNTVQAGGPQGPAQTFDRAGYENALEAAANKNMTASEKTAAKKLTKKTTTTPPTTSGGGETTGSNNSQGNTETYSYDKTKNPIQNLGNAAVTTYHKLKDSLIQHPERWL